MATPEATSCPRSCAARRADRRRSATPKPPWRGRPANGSGGPDAVPDAKAQRNFTDPKSRIMRSPPNGFIYGYNAEGAVDDAHQVMVLAIREAQRMQREPEAQGGTQAAGDRST